MVRKKIAPEAKKIMGENWVYGAEQTTWVTQRYRRENIPALARSGPVLLKPRN